MPRPRNHSEELSMNARSVPLALIFSLLLAFGAVAAACGSGGEGLTLEEYFQRLEKLSDAADENERLIEIEFDQGLGSAGSEEEAIEAYRVFFAAILPAFQEFMDGVDDLDPPAQVEGVHNRRLDGGVDALNFMRAVSNELDQVGSMFELEKLLETVDTDLGFARFIEACRRSQEIADESDIDVDLNCGDE